MFVLPPQPRAANGNSFVGMPPVNTLTAADTGNSLSNHIDQDKQLVLGEGTYIYNYQLHIATPPPHPSDAPQPNNNPLAPRVGPPTTGTSLSLVILNHRPPPVQGLYRTATGRSSRSNVPPSIVEENHTSPSDTTSNVGDSTTSYASSQPVPGFGDSNPALAPQPTKGKKDQKAKPKNNIVKSNSSFVSRVIPHDQLQKRLNDRNNDGILAFANVNRAFVWLDLASDQKAENLTKVLCTKAHAMCHDVNPLTKSTNHLDVIIGFNTSDIIWYEPFSQKYARLNKNGAIHSSPVTAIAWLPTKESLFITAHNDGTLMVYDKEKDDAEFHSIDQSSNNPFDTPPIPSQPTSHFRVLKSVQSRVQKTNPIAAWRLSPTRINAMAFSPDHSLLAIVSDDGTLVLLDYLTERVRDVYRSYFGALLCVTWSPDGRYVLTGGQDDLVSIWSVAERCLVARCVGHESWVTDVKFDVWRGDERSYRFGSVGEDGRLLLWDFSVGMLGRPKGVGVGAGGAGRHRGSVGSGFPERQFSVATITGLGQDGGNGGSGGGGGGEAETRVEEEVVELVHPVQSKASTANLPPIMSKIVDGHPLCWLGFEEHVILTSSADGTIREWSRPKDVP